MSRAICLVTTGHPSTNPRLVKEADALAEAGYSVRVVACKFVPWADETDAEFSGRSWWPPTWVRFGPLASRPRREWTRVRRAVCRTLVACLGFRSALAKRALHYVVPELARAAADERAELYVAHNLGALPAAAHAAARHDARLGFDAEDYHRGEVREAESRTLPAALTRWAEERYMTACDYVTAASEDIAEAYEATLGIESPTTILNVFPVADRQATVPAAELAAEKVPGSKTLYWFSQTIGPKRGLEDALEALPLLDESVHLALRGSWAAGYETEFMARAEDLAVRHRVRILPPVRPGELVVRTSRHDAGLALETGWSENRDLAVTNKIFTYLLAGVPAVVSATKGQRRICDTLPRATRMIPVGEPRALAGAARELLADPGARESAATEAASRFCWDVEQTKLLDLVGRVLGDRPEGEGDFSCSSRTEPAPSP